MSKYYGSGLIGLDVKKRRKVPLSQRNRYNHRRSRWLLPAIVALAVLGFFVVAGMR